jgi:GTPase
VRDSLTEAYSLGFGEAIAVSAEHALGMLELQDAIEPFAEAEEAAEEEDANKPLKLAIIGRPNVGRSKGA